MACLAQNSHDQFRMHAAAALHSSAPSFTARISDAPGLFATHKRRTAPRVLRSAVHATAMAAEAEKKPIRSVLTGVEMFWMLLMPASNVATIALISLSAAGYVDLLHACAAISAFYVLWALRNKIFAGNKLEKGHLTYGTVLAGALARNYALALVGVALVAGSIVYVLRVILPWPLSKLAHGERRRAILPRNSGAISDRLS